MKTNYIKQGDCLELMQELPDESIDLIVTDPPYGIDLNIQRKTSKFKNTTVKNDNTLEWLPNLVNNFKRIMKTNSVIYLFCNWQNYDVFKKEFEKYFELKNLIVWDKQWFGMGYNWRPNHEFIMVLTNGKFKTNSNNNENILRYRRIHPTKMYHSCEKPIALLEKLIEESSNEGDTVLDSFIGSGTTPIAAINTNRKYIGYELDEKYFNIAQQRIDEHILKGGEADE